MAQGIMKFADGVNAAGFRGVTHIVPSKIRAPHIDNSSRAALYSTSYQFPEFFDDDGDNRIEALIGERCCFTRAEVERRVASFMSTSPRGQIDAAHVYKTNTHFPVLTKGYLRHLAFLVIELRGEMSEVEEGSKGLRCMVVPMPKDHEARVKLARANLEENIARKNMTPVDWAWYFKRQLTIVGVTKKSIAEDLNISVSRINTDIQLLGLKLAVQLAVHEGALTKAKALATASGEGEGPMKGPRAGLKHSVIKQFFAARATGYASDVLKVASEQTYTLDDVLHIFARVGGVPNGEGDFTGVDKIVEVIKAAPKPETKRRGRPPKKAPPKLDAKASEKEETDHVG